MPRVKRGKTKGGSVACEGEQDEWIRRQLYAEPDPGGNRKARRAYRRTHGGFKKEQPSEVDSAQD